jgi:hypothetical protein
MLLVTEIPMAWGPLSRPPRGRHGLGLNNKKNNRNPMAKSKSTASSATFKLKTKVRRPGVHAKSKASRSKGAKNYIKRNVGQG